MTTALGGLQYAQWILHLQEAVGSLEAIETELCQDLKQL
jgi:hypothetical protein